jgi:multisubunit Na+/H+ antiporter MnhG subunit
VLLALNSIDSFQPESTAGTVAGGAFGLLLAVALIVSALGIARRGSVDRAAFTGLAGAAVFGWQFLALAPVETAVLGGTISLFDVTTALSALAALVGSVGVCLAEDAYRSATWESAGASLGERWLVLIVAAAFASVVALFLPYATYEARGRYPAYVVDAWHYFGGITDTVTLVLALTCGTLAVLQFARPRLPYRWPLACLGVATFAYVFTPADLGSKAQTGQAVSLDAGFWLLLAGALVMAIAGVMSWRRSVAAGARGTR